MTARRFELELPTSYATYVDRWAIIVGISKYEHESLNLKYADRDAETLYELLLTPSGGGFEKNHVVKLTNEEATTANITRALRSFLKKPAKEDIVLIYFACHGAPDIDRPSIVYLLTHDTDPADISGTALPMREIDLSLRENLLAERLIILADTCHSAAIGGGIGRRDASNNSAVVNRYLQQVSAAQEGIALLTSAEANEVSFEDTKWGGGHGVFTYYLLEGMRGAADYQPRNGIVTVGELFDYVRENVQRATNNQQHPLIGTNNYDRNLPIAITAGISAQEHYELGCQLYQLGLKLDDRHCFESASRRLQEAIRLSRIAESKLPEAYLQLGLTLMAAGDLPRAIQAFEEAMNADVPDAAYYLGIAYLKQGESEKAVQAFESFLVKQPDSDKVAWVRELISWLKPPEISNRYALLIGINYTGTDDPYFKPLRGAVNDIQILNEVLSKKYNFNVRMLSDMEATYENIIKAFGELQGQAKPNDVVVIYYSGHSESNNSIWIACDTKLNAEGIRYNTIGSKELYNLVSSIPSLHKTLIMDSVISQEFEGFIKLVERTKACTLFLAASPSQLSWEYPMAKDNKKTYGVFTYSFVNELSKSSEETKQGEFYERVKEADQLRFKQQLPSFVGNLNKKIFSAKLDYCPDIFDFSQRRNYFALTEEALQNLCKRVNKQLTIPFPDFHYSIGLAFLEKGKCTQAIASLRTALEQAKQNIPNILLALVIAQFKNKLYGDAIQTFQQYLKTSGSADDTNLMREVISEIQQLTESRRYALLVGIEDYPNTELPSMVGAIDYVSDLKNILVSKFNFQESDIKLLLKSDASCQNILTAFRELAEQSRRHSALFYFIGNGSVDAEDNPTIITTDNQQIELNELNKFVNNVYTNLVSIIDANWTRGFEKDITYSSKQSSYTQKLLPLKYTPKKRNLSMFNCHKIGYISIYPILIKYKHENKSFVMKYFSNDLMEFLKKANSESLSYKELYQLFKDNLSKDAGLQELNFLELEPLFVNSKEVLDQIVFSKFGGMKAVETSLRKIEQEQIIQMVGILEHLIEQRNGFAPEGLLNLGIANYALEEYDKSISALQTAIEEIFGQHPKIMEQRSPSGRQQYYPEAHYWFGRVLHESKQDPAGAVSELRRATQQDPDNATAHYYLGQALRALVEKEILTEAEEVFQTYLQAGAPMGQEDEIQEFLKSQKSPEAR